MAVSTEGLQILESHWAIASVPASERSRAFTIATERLLEASVSSQLHFDFVSDISDDELGILREKELKKAIDAIGIKKLIILDYKDGLVADNGALVEKLIGIMRDFRPSSVITFGPDGLSGHKDHIAIGIYKVRQRRTVLGRKTFICQRTSCRYQKRLEEYRGALHGDESCLQRR